jgi:hypothetical protein
MKTVYVDASPAQSASRLAQEIIRRLSTGAPLPLGGATGLTKIMVYPRIIALAREKGIYLDQEALGELTAEELRERGFEVEPAASLAVR